MSTSISMHDVSRVEISSTFLRTGEGPFRTLDLLARAPDGDLRITLFTKSADLPVVGWARLDALEQDAAAWRAVALDLQAEILEQLSLSGSVDAEAAIEKRFSAKVAT